MLVGHLTRGGVFTSWGRQEPLRDSSADLYIYLDISIFYLL
jgi:hypothetical protein